MNANKPMVRFLLLDLDLKAVLEEPEARLTDAAEDDTKHMKDRRRDFPDFAATNNRKKKLKKKRKITVESRDIIRKEEVFVFQLTETPHLFPNTLYMHIGIYSLFLSGAVMNGMADFKIIHLVDYKKGFTGKCLVLYSVVYF